MLPARPDVQGGYLSMRHADWGPFETKAFDAEVVPLYRKLLAEYELAHQCASVRLATAGMDWENLMTGKPALRRRSVSSRRISSAASTGLA
jgi:hypothetical protein